MSLRQPTPPLPSPRGRALIKELRILQKDPLAFLSAVAERYGDFVPLSLGPVKAVILNQPEAVRHILLVNHRNYSKDTFQYNLLSGITGRGLLTSDGDYWLRQRRLAQPAFHRTRLLAMAGMIAEATGRMLAGWEAKAGTGEIVDIDAEMMRLALEIVGKALFRVDLSAEAQELTRAVLTTLDTLVHRSRNPFGPPAWVPTRRNREFAQALRTLDARVYAIIRERRRMEETAAAAGPDEDLLSMLLAARDPESGAGMDDRQLRDEIITLLIAGHETVASALTWTLYLLSLNPAAAARLENEAQEALGERLPTAKDIPNLPYTGMVFDEALRLFPPAWMITRKARAEDKVAGCSIPAGSLVVLSPYSLQRHPGIWENPTRFDPERFSPERAANRPRFSYIPFGGGPRLCIGEGFARFEAILILAAIARRFRLALQPGREVEVEALVTLRPKGGLPMTIQKRMDL